jgi:hypothetical protein
MNELRFQVRYTGLSGAAVRSTFSLTATRPARGQRRLSSAMAPLTYFPLKNPCGGA